MEQHPWLSRPVFLSSTFNDMHAERDYLQQYIFPEIAEALQNSYHHLEVLDFRWGIDTMPVEDQQAKEMMVLKVCLSEIDRSRPFMIVLLGDRYGWMPGDARIKSAAEEMQLAVNNTDISVTALEIAYGSSKINEPMRSFFYIRQPLPYAIMDEESVNRYSDEKNNYAAYTALQEMKLMLKKKFPQNVRSYNAAWNTETKTITGLETLGNMVKADLWSAIQEELNLTQSATPEWQLQEQKLLETFIEENCRSFSGREALLNNCIHHFTDNTATAKQPAVLLQGPSGSGKSAVFSMLYKKMQLKNEMFMLAHSAGVSPLSIQVNYLLQKFCYQLAVHLGIKDESENMKSFDELKNYFHALLKETASRGPVLIMIDAAEQFERINAAQYLTWLPAPIQWPSGLQLFITTGVQTTEAAVIQSGDSLCITLPSFSVDEGEQLVEKIAGHYHKTIPLAVKQAIFSKQLAANAGAAAGNPFWLTLVVNELLVLDADDFSNTKIFSGTPEQQLQQLLVHTVNTIPADLHEAIDYLFSRIEETYGSTYVAFILLSISIARDGLRESDLRGLYTSITQGTWNSALFAVIRRAMRTQMRQQGDTGKWIFKHRLVYKVAAERYYNTPDKKAKSHTQLATYFKTLPAGYDMRGDILYHLLRADAYAGACNYIITEKGMSDADSNTLSVFFKETDDAAGTNVQWILKMIQSAFNNATSKETEQEVIFYVIVQKLMEFIEKMRFENGFPLSLKITSAIIDYIEKRLAIHTSDNLSNDCLYKLLQIKAQLLTASGNADEGLQVSVRAAEINEKFIEVWSAALEKMENSSKEQKQFETIQYHTAKHSLMLNHINIAEHYQAKGKNSVAIEWLNKALEISGWLLNIYPNSPLARKDMANNHIKIASVMLEEKALQSAYPHCQESIELSEWLTKHNPEKNSTLLLIDAYSNMGRLLAMAVSPVKAEVNYNNAYAACKKLKEDDPGDEIVQWKFLKLLWDMANFYAMLTETASAESCYQEAVEACILIANLAGSSNRLKTYLSNCYHQVAIIKVIQGNTALAASLLDAEKQLADEIDG